MIAIPSVVSAMEGAAPKRPAKLLGRTISAMTAKSETMMPPIKKRATSSPAGEDNTPSPPLRGSSRFLNQAHCFTGSLATQQLVLLAQVAMVIDKELFDLLEKERRQILECPNIGVLVIGLGDRQQAIVANLVLPVELLAFDDTNQTGAHHHARVGRFIHQQQDVDGIAVLGKGSRQEAKVIGEGHTCRKDLAQSKHALVGVERELVSASLGSLDNDLQNPVRLFHWLEHGWICQALCIFLSHAKTPSFTAYLRGIHI